MNQELPGQMSLFTVDGCAEEHRDLYDMETCPGCCLCVDNYPCTCIGCVGQNDLNRSRSVLKTGAPWKPTRNRTRRDPT